MNIDHDIITYLSKYGNTREIDVIKYANRKNEHSERGIKKAIKRLEEAKKIHRVVHSEIKPPAVYLSLKQGQKLAVISSETKQREKKRFAFGLFDYLNQRAKRQRIEQLEQWAEADAREETMIKALKKSGNLYDTEIYLDVLHKHRKRYGLEE
jgi:DNA-binding HxlR family transcriptional regulator